MKIPATENALLIRTDFSDANAWKKLLGAVSSPEELSCSTWTPLMTARTAALRLIS